MQDHEIILKTGRIIDFDMACNALKEAGIPFVRQSEGHTGIQEAYVQPVMGPGNYFNLLVPSALKQDAEFILSHLPIENTIDPDFWHYGANKKSKRNWKIYALVVLGISATIFIVNIIKIVLK